MDVSGPVINLEDEQTMDGGGGVSSGVIAGVAIGAGLVIVIIVSVIAVVYCRYAKKKDEEAFSNKPSVFSTCKYLFDKLLRGQSFDIRMGGSGFWCQTFLFVLWSV